ncbi:hypothetical protein D3C76_631210 [compost metagenome]
MARMATPIEDRRLDPSEIRTEANTPDDAGDALAHQIQLATLLHGDPTRLVALARRRINPLLLDVLVDRAIDPVVHRIGIVQILGQVVGELQARALQAVEPTEQLHAFAGKVAQVNITATIATGHVVVGVIAHAFTQRMGINANLVVTHFRQPVDHVLAPVETCATWRISDSQIDFAPGQVQVLGDLRTRLPGANDQHIADGQGLRIAVLLGVKLMNARRQAFGQTRDDRCVITARRDNQLIGGEFALRGMHLETTLGTRHYALDRDTFTGRSIDRFDESGQVFVDLVLLHETVRVAAVEAVCVTVARQCALPVGRHQTEGIPALIAPGVGQAVFFQDQMIDALLLQVVAGG